MRCKYCFYADELNKRKEGVRSFMSYETARNLIARAFDYADGTCTFAFQGGEPTLRGLEFFHFFVKTAAESPARKCAVHYAIQTNGLLIDEAWAAFLKENNFLVGLSLDGSSEIHNANRVDANGRGTYNRCVQAAAILKKYQIPFNILTVVTARSAKNIVSVYNSFMKNGYLYQQYIPCLDPIFEERGQSEFSLTPEAFGNYLIRLFDRWLLDRKNGKFVYVQYFENLAGMLKGYAPSSCGMTGVCSRQNVIEADGSVYPCDFYALDEYLVGNINHDSFFDLDKNRVGFLDDSLKGLEKCQSCPYLQICRGGCRRDRQEANGIGDNYLCEGYKMFFAHALPKLYELIR